MEGVSSQQDRPALDPNLTPESKPEVIEPEPFVDADDLVAVRQATETLGQQGIERFIKHAQRSLTTGEPLQLDYIAAEAGAADPEAYAETVRDFWSAHADQARQYVERELPGMTLETFIQTVGRANPKSLAEAVGKHVRTQSPSAAYGPMVRVMKELAKAPKPDRSPDSSSNQSRTIPSDEQAVEFLAQAREAFARFQRDHIRPARRR